MSASYAWEERTNRSNPVVHDDSVNLLAQVMQGRDMSARVVRFRNALHDRRAPLRQDAGAAESARKELESFIPIDNRVRDAVLEAAAPRPGCRACVPKRFGLLEPVEADSSVREVAAKRWPTRTRIRTSERLATVSRAGCARFSRDNRAALSYQWRAAAACLTMGFSRSSDDWQI